MKVLRLARVIQLSATACSLALSGVSIAATEAPPLEPGQIVESKGLANNPNEALEPYIASVHAILQTHLTPILEKRATQDKEALTRCQDRVLSTVLHLAAKGVTAVVIEGFFASGTLKNPRPLVGPVAPPVGAIDAKWALVGRKEVAAYGFAVPYLNEYSNSVTNDFGKSSAVALLVAERIGKGSSIAKQAASAARDWQGSLG